MFDNLTNRLWLQAQRNQESLQIILVDIDHFKPYNDLYGHQAGDNCIRRVASIIARAAKRPFDFCARYGGEEFALVLYAPSGGDPTALPEQIRRDTMALGIPHAHSDAAGILTVSIGSATARARHQAQPRGLDPNAPTKRCIARSNSAATACCTSTPPSRIRRRARSRSSPSNSTQRSPFSGVVICSDDRPRQTTVTSRMQLCSARSALLAGLVPSPAAAAPRAMSNTTDTPGPVMLHRHAGTLCCKVLTLESTAAGQNPR